MDIKLKKSLITDWWVAEENNKMAFFNILSGETLHGKFFIVGYYLNKNKREIATSTNCVVWITKDGVITEKGSFYPFEEAHALYLQFLIKAAKKNTVVARRWEFIEDSSNQKIIADIVKPDKVKEKIIFDFIPKEKDIMLSGYSEILKKKVVLTTFSKRQDCIIIDYPEEEIYKTSFALPKQSKQWVQKVKNIFEKKISEAYISVECK